MSEVDGSALRCSGTKEDVDGSTYQCEALFATVFSVRGTEVEAQKSGWRQTEHGWICLSCVSHDVGDTRGVEGFVALAEIADVKRVRDVAIAIIAGLAKLAEEDDQDYAATLLKTGADRIAKIPLAANNQGESR